MKHVFIFFITLYQTTISGLLKTFLGTNNMCRFSPSCSEYAKRSIMRYGVAKGSYLSVVRLMSCQPLSK